MKAPLQSDDEEWVGRVRGRANRRNIRLAAHRVAVKCDSILRSFKMMEEMSNGRIEILNRDLPALASAVEQLRQYAISLRSQL